MGISWVQLLIVLVIVLLVFGTKRVRTLGSDLGGAIREFRKGVSDEPDNEGGRRDESAAVHPEPHSPQSEKSKE
ncbi:MAG: twin-arginine translocase TatA/TatE family subunit [Wenzhouxiangella sp.]